MDSKDIFAMALNLSSPWEITKMELTKPDGLKRGQLDIYIDFVAGSQFVDDKGNFCGVYDTEERKWQHLNFFEHNCFLHARVPRIKQKDGKVKTVQVPWARPGSGFTLLFEAFAMLLIAWREKDKIFRWVWTLFCLSIIYSTLYLEIHWVIDVIAGIILALVAVKLGDWLINLVSAKKRTSIKGNSNSYYDNNSYNLPVKQIKEAD